MIQAGAADHFGQWSPMNTHTHVIEARFHFDHDRIGSELFRLVQIPDVDANSISSFVRVGNTVFRTYVIDEQVRFVSRLSGTRRWRPLRLSHHTQLNSQACLQPRLAQIDGLA